jgi:deferrochelatase/peroxidase EfeB
MASTRVLARDRGELRDLLRDLSDEAAALMEGRPPEAREPAYPPVDSGIRGPRPAPDDARPATRTRRSSPSAS